MYLAREGVAGLGSVAGGLRSVPRGHRAAGRAGRLAAVLAQFPPSFHADADTRAYLDWLLGGLHRVPDRRGTAAPIVERRCGRHAAHCCDAFGAAWTLIDEPKFQSSDPADRAASRSPATAPLAYIRLHGRNAAAWWEHDTPDDRYNYLYSPDELRPFARRRRRGRRHAQARARVFQQSLLGQSRGERGRAQARSRADPAGDVHRGNGRGLSGVGRGGDAGQRTPVVQSPSRTNP